MYSYENNSGYSAQEMIQDYLEFRRDREKRLNAVKNISEASVNNYKADSFEMLQQKPYFVGNTSGYARVYDRQADEFGKNILPDEFKGDMITGDINMSDKDKIYVKQVSSDIAKKIYTVIEKVVDEMEYEESPIYDDYIPKVFVDNITDKAYDYAVAVLPELSDLKAGEIQNDGTYGYGIDNTFGINVWSKSAVTKELIRQLLFIEIFGRRRPHKRNIRDDYRYY